MKHPVTPAVYRPQPAPKVLQRKIPAAPKAGQASRPPVAPPVYRPQIKPAIAQTKMAVTPQMRTHPVAPPVYRPQSRPAVQQKLARLTQTGRHGVQRPPAPVGPHRPPVAQRPGANSKSRTPSQTNSTVQRYTLDTIPELGGYGKLSQNGNYFIPGQAGKAVYVANTATGPRDSKEDKGTGPITANGKTYYKWESRNFVRDCLHTAEEIINQTNLAPHADVYSKVSGTTSDFGNSDEENIALAESDRASDAKASPGLGQAYVIVNKSWLEKPKKKRGRKRPPPQLVKSPYHAAAVVAVDGNDRITLEVFANTQDAKDYDTKGDYRMYTTGADGETFHSFWQRTYFKSKSATLVIERK